MKNRNSNLYLTFTTVFLIMHLTGAIASDLPYILNALITSVTSYGVLLLFLKWNHSRSLNKRIIETGLNKTSLRNIAPGIVLSVVLALAYPLLGSLLNTTIVLEQNWILNLAGLFLTAGLTEEILFRGYFLGNLSRNIGFRKAILHSAISFTLAHLLMFAYMDWPVALLSTILAAATAVPLAFLYEKGNKTVWSPAFVHTTIRTIGLVVTVDEKQFHKFSIMWIITCMVLPYIVLMSYKEFRSLWIKQG